MIIGITGQIGSGKSTAAAIFKKLGAAIIDADQIGREVVESNPQLIRKIAKAFGPDTLSSHGKLDRAKVAKAAFSNKSNKKKLDRLVHQFLLANLKKEIKNLSNKHALIVIDAALLLDWKLDKIVDRVLVIHSSREKRLKRLQARGIKKPDALARQKMQPTFKEFKSHADKVILNNSDQKTFVNKVKLWAGQFIS